MGSKSPFIVGEKLLLLHFHSDNDTRDVLMGCVGGIAPPISSSMQEI